MANRFLYTFFCFLLIHHLSAQHRVCHAMEHDTLLKERSEAYDQAREQLEKDVAKYLEKRKALKTSANNAVLTIPVVVHVIHKNASGFIGGTNISDAKILSQIEVLNEDFRKKNADTTSTRTMFKSVAADARIEFCMATVDPNGNESNGITRHYDANSSCYNSNSDDDIASIISWPTNKYLNIWVAELCGDLQGFAQLPSGSTESGLPSSNVSYTDGVYVDYQFFGTIGSPAPYDLGRPCVHEVGHWLGLLHPWGGFGCGSTDYVSDTPIQNSPTYDCPANNTPCSQVTMYENFMGYDYDNCMSVFTEDQVERMWAVLNSSPRRKGLFTSSGCCGAVCSLPYLESFESENFGSLGCEWEADTTNDWHKINEGAYGTSDSSLKSVTPAATVADTNTFYTPGINFTNTPGSTIAFDYAYAGDGSATTDTLTLAYALSCSNDWVLLTSLHGEDLKTTSRTTGGGFIPLSDEWETFTMELPTALNGRIVRFRLENSSSKENPVYLDNININKISSNLNVAVYPNPVENNKIALDVIYKGEKDVKIDIYSTSGVEVYSNLNTNISSYIYEINTKDMARGIYLVRVTVGNDVIVKKFVKN